MKVVAGSCVVGMNTVKYVQYIAYLYVMQLTLIIGAVSYRCCISPKYIYTCPSISTKIQPWSVSSNIPYKFFKT
jgi:hypothetical protein